MTSWTPYVAIWTLLAVIVIVLAAYRKMLSTREDDSLHVSEGSKALVSEQIANSQKIEVVEKWGKLLTIIAVVTGVVMMCIYIYNIFQTGAHTVAIQ
jgi:hypothetical protein